MSAKSTNRNRVLRLFVASMLATVPATAKANGDGWWYGGYHEPDREAIELGRAYFIDPVNRRSSLTPEPVWREMFPGIHRRMEIEAQVYGRPGRVERELRYWRRVR